MTGKDDTITTFEYKVRSRLYNCFINAGMWSSTHSLANVLESSFPLLSPGIQINIAMSACGFFVFLFFCPSVRFQQFLGRTTLKDIFFLFFLSSTITCKCGLNNSSVELKHWHSISVSAYLPMCVTARGNGGRLEVRCFFKPQGSASTQQQQQQPDPSFCPIQASSPDSAKLRDHWALAPTHTPTHIRISSSYSCKLHHLATIWAAPEHSNHLPLESRGLWGNNTPSMLEVLGSWQSVKRWYLIYTFWYIVWTFVSGM